MDLPQLDTQCGCHCWSLLPGRPLPLNLGEKTLFFLLLKRLYLPRSLATPSSGILTEGWGADGVVCPAACVLPFCSFPLLALFPQTKKGGIFFPFLLVVWKDFVCCIPLLSPLLSSALEGRWSSEAEAQPPYKTIKEEAASRIIHPFGPFQMASVRPAHFVPPTRTSFFSLKLF